MRVVFITGGGPCCIVYRLNPNRTICLLVSLEEMEDPLPPEHWFSLKIIHKDKEKGNESNVVEEKKETEICNVVTRKSWSEFKRYTYCLLTHT